MSVDDKPAAPQPQPEVEATGQRLLESARPSVVQIFTNTGMSGSGFIADEAGRIVTDAHVIENANEIIVRAADGKEYKAGLEKLDDTGDLAVLKLLSETKIGPHVNFRSTADLQPGEPVFTVGHGLGRRNAVLTTGFFEKQTTPMEFYTSFSAGVPAELDRRTAHFTPAQRTDFLEAFGKPALRANLPTNHGDSGGPTYDANGNVIGAAQIMVRGISALTPSERIEALLREPGKFRIGHGFRSEEWTERAKAYASGQPIEAAAYYTGMTALAGGGTIAVSKLMPRVAGGGFALYGAGKIFGDLPNYFDATDSRDAWRYGIASGGDALQIAGGIAMMIPRVRTVGMVAATVGLGTRVASDFIPTHYVVTDLSRADGDTRAPFSWDKVVSSRKTR